MVFEAKYKKKGYSGLIKRITFHLSDSATGKEKQQEIEAATPDGYVFFDPDRGSFFNPQMHFFLKEGRG